MTDHQPPPAAVLSLQVGRIAPLGPEGVPSGFVKGPVTGPVQAGRLGLEGDEQADLTVHGGPDKAIYFYPSEHYANWFGDVPQHVRRLVPGAFGENVTTTGLDEATVAIGDVFRIGSAEVQVTQPRQPCFKLGLRFEDNTLGRIMMQTGRTGWYVRVLTPGELRAGDAMVRLRQTNPEWTIARFNAFLLHKRGDRAELASLAEVQPLAAGWRDGVRAALAGER